MKPQQYATREPKPRKKRKLREGRKAAPMVKSASAKPHPFADIEAL